MRLKCIPGKFNICLLVSILAAIFTAISFHGYNQRYLECKVKTSESAWGELYFVASATKQLKESKIVKIAGSASVRSIRLPLLNKPFSSLIFHITSLNGSVIFSDIKITNGLGTELVRIPVTALEPFPDTVLTMTGNQLSVRPVIPGQSLDIKIPVEFRSALSLGGFSFVVSRFLLVLLVLGALLYGSSLLVRQNNYTGAHSKALLQPGYNGLKTNCLLVSGVFLMVLGARLWLIQTFASDIPYDDQWDAEALQLYIPYLDGSMSWRSWIQPYNEHRLLMTRLVQLPLFLLNGQWDGQVQMVVNAILYAGIVSAVCHKLVHTATRMTNWVIIMPILFSLPFGWENTLFGFQLVFYQMIGLSLVTLYCLLKGESNTWSWWGGVLCAVFALFTIASGLLVCVSVFAICVVELFRKKVTKRHDLIVTALSCIVIIAVGFALLPHVAAQEKLHSHSFGEFLLFAARNLAWPLVDFPVWGIFQWLPFTLLFLRYFQSDSSSLRVRFTCGLGLYVLLQIAAIAYARGGLTSWPESRYQDVLALGVPVNLYALWLITPGEWTPVKTNLIRSLLYCWLIANCAGFTYLTCENLVHQLPDKRLYQQAGAETLKAYRATNQVEALLTAPRNTLPYHVPIRLAIILSNPQMTNFLPPSLVADGATGRLRPAFLKLLLCSNFIFGGGCICICASLLKYRRVDSRFGNQHI